MKLTTRATQTQPHNKHQASHPECLRIAFASHPSRTRATIARPSSRRPASATSLVAPPRTYRPTRSPARVVSLLISHQPTLRDALRATIEYRHLINDSLALQIEEAGPSVILREEVVAGVPARDAGSGIAARGIATIGSCIRQLCQGRL